MFRKNTNYQQPALISAAGELPEKQRKRLENSWAGAFYHESFCRIDEDVRSVKHPFPAGKLPVRGSFRMTGMILASAALTKVRRSQRFSAAKTRPRPAKSGGQTRSQAPKDSFFASAWYSISRWLRPDHGFGSMVGC